MYLIVSTRSYLSRLSEEVAMLSAAGGEIREGAGCFMSCSILVEAKVAD